MWKKFIILTGVGLMAAAALFVLFGFAKISQAGVKEYGELRNRGIPVMLADSLSISDVQPNSAPNNLDTPIIVFGTGFSATISGTVVITPPVVLLDDIALPEATWISSTQLGVSVPWGLEPGIYTVTVVNPDGAVSSLAKAFTVTQGIGVWTTNGPYGGHVIKLMAHPEISGTVYAHALDGGLYRSADRGEFWEKILAADLLDVALRPAPPYTLLAGDQYGLYRSIDEGTTWQQVMTNTGVNVIAYAPSSADKVYVSITETVQVSDDDGQTWREAGSGLKPTFVTSLAVHPISESKAYAGSWEGRLFKTVDSGDSWQEMDTSSLPDEAIWVMEIDPYNPERIYVTSDHTGSLFHRSLDGGLTWEEMSLGGNLPEGAINDFAFHPVITGTMYGMTCWGLLESSDAGANWSLITMLPDCMWSVELDIHTGNPLYGGGGARGVFRTEDGGYHWRVKSEGMDALLPWGLAASAVHPEQVYLAAGSAGGFSSNNAAESWLSMDINGGLSRAAADPNQPCVGYFGGSTGHIGYIYKTESCGLEWISITLPGDPMYYETIEGIAVDLHNSDRLFAGGLRGNDLIQFGMVYSSTNGGLTWSEVDVGQPISSVYVITFDPIVSETVYMATGGWYDRHHGSVLKSQDGGLTWEVKDNGLTGAGITSLQIDPRDSDVLYLTAHEGHENSRGGLFKSENGGESWQALTQDYPNTSMTSLAIDPLQPDTLYVGTWRHSDTGLYESTDGGVNWSRVDGPLGYADVYCMTAEATDERTFLYVGVAGGVAQAITGTVSTSLISADTIGGGVYQQTIVHPPPTRGIFLPLIIRGQ